MKLQLALDLVTLAEARAILDEVHDLIDIIEIGTPLIIREGVRAITEIKQHHPSRDVLADIKIMDAGEHEAKLALDAGADIVTVLGAATDTTIQKATATTHAYQKKVMIDMIAIQDVAPRARQIEALGVDYICVHTASDVQAQGHNPLEDLKSLQHALNKARAAVAGGINLDMVQTILPYQPDIVIVGGAITTQQQKRPAALAIREAIA
ncbi:3-hexulose-6-phosphate synthase [candidate division KSB3 bacterium]|uniref:3-hexulose-6-phosphate synthase n=1 Tax=candidate division KSB3 bacterium TaxID=2044937 RepID=A0A9D5Q5Y7_9BACT|nr:3-hexulose-6-phosphate synthase [candidate division KSB3 bacterium]MBD3324732.1 3-hexulose-6-phosphate synthase [candidate division KSB3 bacterium]